MMLLIGLIVGILIVVVVLTVYLVALRFSPQDHRPAKRKKGRHSIGPTPDTYGEPHIDNHGWTTFGDW